MARLVVETGQEAGMVYPVGLNPVFIGRSADCEIQVVDRRVSRKHALIKKHGLACTLEDLNSRNGTFLNHQPLLGIAQLRSGDLVSVGGMVLAFEADPVDTEESASTLRRVRLTPGDFPRLKAEKAVALDTEPLVSEIPVTREMMSDPQQRLRMLYRVSESLRSELDLEALLPKIMNIIWMVVSPDRGIVLVYDSGDQGRTLKPAVVKVRDDSDEDIIISQGIVERSLQEQSAILSSNASSDVRFSDNDSVIISSIRSVICSPLIANGQVLGAIYVDTQEDRLGETHTFSGEDLEIISGISVQAALAIQNAKLHHQALKHQRLERELEIARDIQISLLPQTYPQIEGVSFAATCQPARQVGGDYYDFFPVSGDKLAVVIGDASGKGVPAAILISTVRAACRAQAQVRSSGNIKEIVAAVNQALCTDSQCENFASLFIMVYDPFSRSITYTNAGHAPPLLLRDNGNVVRLTDGGCLLGVTDESGYEHSVVQLGSNDVLVLYTDGVTDTQNLRAELFSEERLTQAALASRRHEPEKTCESIYQSVIQFRESNQPFDDLTLLIMKLL